MSEALDGFISFTILDVFMFHQSMNAVFEFLKDHLGTYTIAIANSLCHFNFLIGLRQIHYITGRRKVLSLLL